MKAIISRERNDGTFAEVGTSDRTVVAGLTYRGVIRRARRYAQGKRFRVELFHDEQFYAEPYRVIIAS